MSVPGNTVIVLLGPTGSGKTAVSLPLAHRINAEIISADSRQVYRYLDVGTAKPVTAQLREIPHHFIDLLDPVEEMNSGEFGIRGRDVVAQVFQRGRVPLVVGGSGLYIRSLIDGLFDGPSADMRYRSILDEQLRTGGVEPLLDQLRHVDPESAARIDPTKPRRVVRALEVFHKTGVPLSVLHRQKPPAITFAVREFGLLLDRAELHRRIEERVDQMIEQGLVAEVERLASRGYSSELNALNTVGYAEAFAYLRGELTFEAMVHLIKQNTRRYAKRQMTWFRRDQRIEWIEAGEGRLAESIAEEIISRF